MIITARNFHGMGKRTDAQTVSVEAFLDYGFCFCLWYQKTLCVNVSELSMFPLRLNLNWSFRRIFVDFSGGSNYIMRLAMCPIVIRLAAQ